jgi:hypothetical protein
MLLGEKCAEQRVGFPLDRRYPMARILAFLKEGFSARQFSSLLFILDLLLSSEIKTFSCAQGKSESAFSRFLGVYRWDLPSIEEARKQEHWAQVATYMKECHIPRLTLRLILDEIVVPKSGTAFDRLGVHYSSTLDKTVPGHCFVVLYASIGPFRFPLDYRWYVNEEYCEEAELEFKTKPQHGLELLHAFEMPSQIQIRQIELLVDGGYAEKEIFDYALAEEWHMYTRVASDSILEEIAFVGVAGKEYHKTLAQIKSGESVTPAYLGHPVKVVRQKGSKGPKYLMTNNLEASNSKIRKRAKLRWEIEVFFRRIKQHLGFGAYRVRKWQAIDKYILCVWLAYMVAVVEAPPPLDGDLMLLRNHQKILAWRMLQATMPEYLLARLLLLKSCLNYLILSVLL